MLGLQARLPGGIMPWMSSPQALGRAAGPQPASQPAAV